MNWQAAERDLDDELTTSESIPRTFERSAERNAAEVAQQYKGGIHDRSLVAADVVPAAPVGDYADLTYAEMRSIVRNLAAGFRELGVERGTRVAIFAHTRMEWAQVDFAALAAGATVTTIYPSSSDDQLEYLLTDPEATVVVAENQELLDQLDDVRSDLPHDLESVVTLDEVTGDADDETVHALGDVHERGADAFDRDAYEEWIDATDMDDLASLIYTSGTTGRPKGVQLTHHNFRSNLTQCYRRLGPRPDKGPDVPATTSESTTLSYLPLSHVFERLAGHFLMFAVGATVAYAESPETLKEDFGLVEPTTATSVPRVYEKLYDGIREQASASPVKQRIFQWAVDVGRAHYETDDPGAVLDLKRSIADTLVFSNVRDALGGNVDYFVSGGGSLSAELCALYHAMDLPILEGYGLTETSPVVAVNPGEAPKVGTIGPPVVETDLALEKSAADDGLRERADGEVGELLVRGPQVTDGYWNRPEATADAFTEAVDDAVVRDTGANAGDPWFRTGDVVEVDADGYLVFHERTKQLLVLSTGKNVAPGPIEDRFAANEFVEQCLVLGDGRKFVSALIVPNFDRIRAWAAEEGVELPPEPRAVCRHDAVRERIEREVEAVNEAFEEYERIKQFRLVPEEFTTENDLLTPTMKKKRRNILERFADDVELIYESAE
ncbi:AMP-dependent synthetase/ligase [Haloparvum sp. AD34]